jgi:hypothetical protein
LFDCAIRRTLEITLQSQDADSEKKRAGPNVRLRNKEVASWPQGAAGDDAGG